MDFSHLYAIMQDLKEIFDIVRLVDADRMEICNPDENGNITREDYKCFAVWNKHERCENCISAKACSMNTRIEKFEFINEDIYHVVSKCITIENTRYALEVVTKTNDETLFEAYGKSKFIKTICNINKKMYSDELTGLKNRRYYDEQKLRLDKAEAMALIDIDSFKKINDTYGHPFGDVVLKAVADTIQNTVRKSDTVIRYGGDEIYVIFQQMSQNRLEAFLNAIQSKVKEISFPDKPEIEISLSIGGCYRSETSGDPIEVVDKRMYQAKKIKNCIVI